MLFKQFFCCRQRFVILKIPNGALIEVARRHRNVRERLAEPPIRTQAPEFSQSR